MRQPFSRNAATDELKLSQKLKIWMLIHGRESNYISIIKSNLLTCIKLCQSNLLWQAHYIETDCKFLIISAHMWVFNIQGDKMDACYCCVKFAYF